MPYQSVFVHSGSNHPSARSADDGSLLFGRSRDTLHARPKLRLHTDALLAYIYQCKKEHDERDQSSGKTLEKSSGECERESVRKS
ncbi:UspA domain-containing protein [Anopheles sinensis]|uniref:UspA domain-containing protein n=1 Tax=Anopheles sinensis TaxID=74873 RepID=A0A084WE61_ANOSI|nr:UspA domain-containing protein [Anopheles sinensis]